MNKNMTTIENQQTEIGIDQIGFYTPEFYLDMDDLAIARQVDPNKFKIGIGQDQMAVLPPDQDVVTMAGNAAEPLLDKTLRAQIDLIIFATESGVDQSKAAALYLQRLLQLQAPARAFEIKEACYGATAGLQIAYDHLATHPESQKVLVVGADVARYGLKTAGEVTQGAGAIAMIVSRKPRLLVLQQPSAYYSEEIMDFWRPNYRREALAQGKYSTQQYLRFLKLTWQLYQEKTGAQVTDMAALLFHIPFTKLGLKGLRQMTQSLPTEQAQPYFDYFNLATRYNRQVGNLYTGSLYLSLLSLLASGKLATDSQLGLYSYGSGAVAEFFTAKTVLDATAATALDQQVTKLLTQRKRLSVAEYEELFNFTLPTDGERQATPHLSQNAQFYLAGIDQHQRCYRQQGVSIQ